MIIDTRQIPPEGLILTQDISSGEMDLDVGIIKFSGPIRITAHASKITNAVTVDLTVAALMRVSCSRCLSECKKDFKKGMRLNYQVESDAPIIDLNPDIRDEIMLDYPIKPLCKPDCKGLCPKCGKNLNEEKCNCGS